MVDTSFLLPAVCVLHVVRLFARSIQRQVSWLSTTVGDIFLARHLVLHSSLSVVLRDIVSCHGQVRNCCPIGHDVSGASLHHSAREPIFACGSWQSVRSLPGLRRSHTIRASTRSANAGIRDSSRASSCWKALCTGFGTRPPSRPTSVTRPTPGQRTHLSAAFSRSSGRDSR